MSTHERRPLVLAAQLGLDPSDLDEVVHELHSHTASVVNNGGLERQVTFLLEHLAPDEVEQGDPWRCHGAAARHTSIRKLRSVMTVVDARVRSAIQDVVDYNWPTERVDYERQDARGREHHVFRALSMLAAWLTETESGSVPVERTVAANPDEQGTGPADTAGACSQIYLGWIAWDLEGFDDPRDAAETLWRRINNSTGPVVDLIDEHGRRLRVDLELEPGHDDVGSAGRETTDHI